MSKMNLSRCAAVGIAGLTAMSSIAIVASAATQTSMLYELKYSGIETISMKGNTTYGNGNLYCNPVTPADDIMMDGGFVTTLSALTSMTGSYNVVSNGLTNATDLNAGDIWAAADFTSESDNGGTKWAYTAYGEIAAGGAGVVKLVDPYQARTGATSMIFTFMTESERTAAKNTMIAKIKSDYSALAAKAQAQFRIDINDAKAKALKRAADAKQGAIDGANSTYAGISSPTADDLRTKNETIQTANNKYNAISNALNTSSSKIISEFNATFNANNFVYDYKSGTVANDTFGEGKAPVTYGSTVGGISGVDTATYTSAVGGTALDLTTSMYNIGSTVYNAPSDYVFKGELQTYANITGSQLVGNGNWRNFQVIDNNANSGGNTNPDGSSTSGGNNNNNNNNNNTTTATTWYPDSSAYRAASDVSYQGQNGSWYTSASAAELYGGGYTGASKNSNFSAVNSANTEGKAIYFNSTTGTYSTSSSSYSYIVKEATSTPNNNDDPYYNYFFGNGGSSTTNKVPSGSPAINGTRYAGWTNIANYITARGKSGTVLTINMNEGTVVPSNVLSAAKSKNVTLTFKNKNGSTVTVRPSTSMAGNDLNTSVTYNVKDVKSSLVSKAKKVNSAVSSAQIRVGADGSIGGTETVGVKFSTRRSGYTVKAYRLTESGSLRKEATGTINSSGRVNLNLTKGGSYVLVVCR